MVNNLTGKSKCIIIFSGYNPRAIISFLRTLNKHKVVYAIIAIENDFIYQTRYKERVLSARKFTELRLDDMIRTIKEVQAKIECDEYIIAPTSEALNRFLLENRNHFEKLNCTIPLVQQELYNQISNKHSFAELCRSYSIRIPEEIEPNGKAVMPYVAKPRKYRSEKNMSVLCPVIICSQDDYNKFIKCYDEEDFYFQRYIEGRSCYLLYYFHRNGHIYKYSQENLVQQPEGKSIVAAVSSDLHNSTEASKYEKLFKSIGFHGLVMVEVRGVNNDFYMIEANPRFWGPSQLFVDAGMNLFEAFLNDYDVLEKINLQAHKKETKYFWFGGYLSVLYKNDSLVYYNYCPTQLAFDLTSWISSDIYRREDTIELFKNETGFNKVKEIKIE